MNEQKTAQPEDQKKAPSEGQLTLEHATKLTDIEERVNKLEERILKTEVLADSLSQGHSILCSVLEGAGLMKNGEPVQPASWDHNKIPWAQTEGAKGSYDRYPAEGQKPEASESYKNMLADIKRHDGKMSRDGYFFWLFTDGATVGRKLRKGKETQKAEAKADSAEHVKAKFPADLAKLLSFEVQGDYIIAKPTQFLGSENFAKIAAIVRDNGGEYISAGKQSHFKVPIKK